MNKFIDKLDLNYCVFISLIVSIIFLFMSTTWSTDIYRYIWDGGLLVHQINPYTITPEKAYPAIFNQEYLFSHMSWKNQYTVYPPVAQIIFAVAYLLYTYFGIIGAKILLGLPVVLLAIFFYEKIEKKYFMFLLLNPFILFEAFNGGHIDFWMILFLVLSIYFYKKENLKTSAVFLGLAVLTKLYPLIFLPYFVFDLYKKSLNKSLTFISITIFSIFLFYIPIFGDISFLINRYVSWVKMMEFNSSIFTFTSYSLFISVIFLTINLFINKFSIKTLILATIAFFAFSSVVYPWYISTIFYLVIYSKTENEKYFNLNLLTIFLFQILISFTYITEFTNISWEQKLYFMNYIKIFEYSIVYLLLLYIFYINFRFKQHYTIHKSNALSNVENVKNILAVIPVYNEEETLLTVIDTLKEAGIKNIFVGVDCKTNDNTIDILKSHNIKYLVSDKKGFDYSLNKVVDNIQKFFPDTTHVLFLDAGNKYSAKTYSQIINTVGDSDLILGTRINGKENMYWHQKLGTLIVLIPIWIIFYRRIQDISPLRIIKLDLLLKLKMQPMMYRYTTEMLIKCLSLNSKIIETPIILQHRIGKSKISSNPKNSLRAGKDMLSALKFSFYKIIS